MNGVEKTVFIVGRSRPIRRFSECFDDPCAIHLPHPFAQGGGGNSMGSILPRTRAVFKPVKLRVWPM